MTKSVLGVIGGSGVYDMAMDEFPLGGDPSPWGEPSDEFVRPLDGVEVVFLPRHGRGHPIPPSEIDYRANIDALKRAGVHRPHLDLGLRLVPRGTARRAPS